MSTSAADVSAGAVTGTGDRSFASGLRTYFASDRARTVQTVLGLIWLLDGGLQFQSFMYGKGFIQSITGLTGGQPNWVADSVNWGAHQLAASQDLWNTLFALIQVAIGLGLLYRPAVKPAILLSFGWVLVVWWFGEAFGMLFMSTTGMGGVPMANALNGAPGGVLLYALVAASAWPNGRPGGLFGVSGTKRVWGVLWLYFAFLWLTPASTAANGITNIVNAAPSGMSWLSSVQDWFAHRAQGNGEWLAIVFALISAAIALAVLFDRYPREALIAGIVLALAIWVIGEGFGGMFEGGATDPNTGPLLVLLACCVFAVLPAGRAATPNFSPGSTSAAIPQPGGSP
jgi:hypothetical protein